MLSSTLSTFKSLCKHFSELNYKCDIWHEMKDPDHNAVITVKILYHSKREQISHATLFKNWYILKQQHLKLWLLASCSSRFKWGFCALAQELAWLTALGHSRLPKPDTRSCSSIPQSQPLSCPLLHPIPQVRYMPLPTYRVCQPVLHAEAALSPPDTPHKQSTHKLTTSIELPSIFNREQQLPNSPSRSCRSKEHLKRIPLHPFFTHKIKLTVKHC